jgi:hypothetical protein
MMIGAHDVRVSNVTLDCLELLKLERHLQDESIDSFIHRCCVTADFVGEGCHHHPGLPVFRSSGLPVFRSSGLPVFRSFGLSVFRSFGLSVFRSFGLSVFRSSSANFGDEFRKAMGRIEKKTKTLGKMVVEPKTNKL